MNALMDRLKSPRNAGIFGFVVGLVIGLVVLGWGLWPVVWTDASPEQLRAADLQPDYLRMAIDSFARTANAEEARSRYQGLGAAGPDAMAAVVAAPGHLTLVEIEAFKAVIEFSPEGTPAEAGAEKPSWSPWLWVLCTITFLIGVAWVLLYLFRRGPVSTGDTAAMQAAQATRHAERTDYSTSGESPPLSQFMTTFMLGDDLFDDSFSIDSPAGEFLGECGVGIADTAGPGEPKRVNAFEVWLFDKNDIQTVTKVVMSESAFHDVSTHDRLSAKGDPVLADDRNPVILQTAKLRLVARVVDLSYGDDASLPANSHFERLTLELAVWPK